ncbi:alpha/beta hydrolase [Methylibium sp.]|uniref:alpha/beta hydrolase n=1 Tax=Methylibium sp. TaxID=2067992 RepID=UPI003D12A534
MPSSTAPTEVPADRTAGAVSLPVARGRRAARPRAAVRFVAGLVLLAGVLYTAALAALWLGQERLLFQPVVLDPARPLSTEPDVHERVVDVPGARLSVLELRLPDPKGVVFFLHGNGGNLESWFVNTAFYRQANYDLVMPDYRGYGKSTGRIDGESQLQADMQAVWEQVAPRYQGRRVVFYGRSLGTGLAAGLAAKVQPDLTILVSPYLSMVALARQHYPWVPAPVLRYPLRTDEQLPRIRTPVLLLHGDRDELIPLAHSQALLPLAPRARLVVVPGAGHADLQASDSYRQALRTALQDP